MLPAPADGWSQVYPPRGWHWLPGALVAAIPVVALLLALTAFRQSAPRAAAIGAAAAILVAVLFVGMPWPMTLSSFALGALNGLLPIGWIVFVFRAHAGRGLPGLAALPGPHAEGHGPLGRPGGRRGRHRPRLRLSLPGARAPGRRAPL